MCSSKDTLHSTAPLEDPKRIDVEYLNSYRNTLLLGTNDSSVDLNELCRLISDNEVAADAVLSGAAIRALSQPLGDVLVARFLDMETHAVIQVLGDAVKAEPFVSRLEGMNIERLLDPRRIPTCIASWGDGLREHRLLLKLVAELPSLPPCYRHLLSNTGGVRGTRGRSKVPQQVIGGRDVLAKR